MLVQRARKELLTRASFARDQHGQIAIERGLELAQCGAQRATLADDVNELTPWTARRQRSGVTRFMRERAAIRGVGARELGAAVGAIGIRRAESCCNAGKDREAGTLFARYAVKSSAPKAVFEEQHRPLFHTNTGHREREA